MVAESDIQDEREVERLAALLVAQLDAEIGEHGPCWSAVLRRAAVMLDFAYRSRMPPGHAVPLPRRRRADDPEAVAEAERQAAGKARHRVAARRVQASDG